MSKHDEPALEPELPIIDPHHHLWFQSETAISTLEASESVSLRNIASVLRRTPRYLLDEFVADVTSGHNVRATVFVQTGSMYRANGPKALKSLGEVEFANGMAAMAASGLFGAVKACAGIVGHADLSLGDAVEDILGAHIQAGGSRYRGVRFVPAGGLLDRKFRTGFKWLQKLGLSFDAFVLEPQLPDLIDLAHSFPETQIVLNHVGWPVDFENMYSEKQAERFPIWRDNIRTLSTCGNVTVKLGGQESFRSRQPSTSEQLAAEWKPYIETCIEAFGANRCMFESDYPPASSTCTYAVLWNAFKRLAVDVSKEEKTALFSGTAARIYRLDVPNGVISP